MENDSKKIKAHFKGGESAMELHFKTRRRELSFICEYFHLKIKKKILSQVVVTYKTGFGLDLLTTFTFTQLGLQR
jgi:hypothetical protein